MEAISLLVAEVVDEFEVKDGPIGSLVREDEVFFPGSDEEASASELEDESGKIGRASCRERV